MSGTSNMQHMIDESDKQIEEIKVVVDRIKPMTQLIGDEIGKQKV